MNDPCVFVIALQAGAVELPCAGEREPRRRYNDATCKYEYPMCIKVKCEGCPLYERNYKQKEK